MPTYIGDPNFKFGSERQRLTAEIIMIEERLADGDCSPNEEDELIGQRCDLEERLDALEKS